MTPKIPTTVAGYSVLPVSLPATPAYPVQATHHIYLRAHSPKIPIPRDERSLFLVNVPIDSTAAHLRAVFVSLVGPGRFENVVFARERKNDMPDAFLTTPQQREKGGKKRKRENPREVALSTSEGELPQVWDRTLHRSGSTAVVVMADTKSVEAALKAVRKVHKTGEFPVWGQAADGTRLDVAPLGSKRYLAHHMLQYPDKAAIQASVDDFMANFNKKEEEAAQQAKRARNVPDDDGFITVTRGGRTGPARREEAEKARRKELAKEEEKKKSMGDFYRFQGRERRKEEQGELMRRFEEDRKRVESMRNEKRSRFRPE